MTTRLLRTIGLLMSGYAATGTAMVLLSRHIPAARRAAPPGLPPLPPYPPPSPARRRPVSDAGRPRAA